MIQHTPGPWQCSNGQLHVRDDRVPYQAMARVEPETNSVFVWPPWRERRANAQLITAAPDLVSELSMICGMLTDAADDETLGALVRGHEAGIRAARNKATGC